MKKLVLCLATSLIITGCATTKISSADQTKLNQVRAAIKTSPVALITDGCLTRSELGTSLIVGEPSRLTAQKFSDLLSTQLSAQGVDVSKSLTPFVCGFMSEVQLKKYDFKSDNEAKRAEITEYPLVNLANNATKPEHVSLFNLNQSFNKWHVLLAKNAQEKKPTNNSLELADEDVTVLKNLTQSNYVFVSALIATDASFGKKFAAGALSVGVSLATVGAGTGLVTAYIPQEGQHYTVHLVDLDKKEVLWTSGGMFTGKPYSVKQHSVEVKNVLGSLFTVATK